MTAPDTLAQTAIPHPVGNDTSPARRSLRWLGLSWPSLVLDLPIGADGRRCPGGSPAGDSPAGASLAAGAERPLQA
ncbi:MAG: hypothetical protein ACREFZ_11005, partial [Acetobacteraceae bacterium]